MAVYGHRGRVAPLAGNPGPAGNSGVARVSVAALVLTARAAWAQVVAAYVGERVSGPVAPVLDATAFRRSRVLQLARPVRLEARRNCCPAASRCRARRVRAAALRSGLPALPRGRGLPALRRGLPTAGRRRVPAPVGGVPAALARTALAAAALAAAALAAATLAAAAALAAALPRAVATTAALGGAAPLDGGPGERRGWGRRLRLARWRAACLRLTSLRPPGVGAASRSGACRSGARRSGARRSRSGAEYDGRRAAGNLLDDRVLLHLELQVEEVPDRLLLDAVHHGVEHVVALPLVFDQRVALRHRAQPDALAEVVHLI